MELIKYENVVEFPNPSCRRYFGFGSTPHPIPPHPSGNSNLDSHCSNSLKRTHFLVPRVSTYGRFDCIIIIIIIIIISPQGFGPEAKEAKTRGDTLESPAYRGNVVKGKVPEKISIFINSAHKGSTKCLQRIYDTLAKD